MRQCWPEGELRAYLDCELPAREMQQVEAHVNECAACGSLLRELEQRSERIEDLLEFLADTEPVPQVPALRRRSLVSNRAVVGALALAAAVAMIFVLLPRRVDKPVAARRPQPPAPVAPAPVPPPVTVKPAIIRRAPGKRATPAKPRPHIVNYVALDSEPIETGIIVRVGLDNGQVPADVILGPDGRARAIRFIDDVVGDAK